MRFQGIKYNQELYLLVAVLCLFLIVAATGGGLFGSDGYWTTHWQHKAFRTLCHQDPSRSYWINGQPMAVCTRCFGIYTGFTVCWFTIPFLAGVQHTFTSYAKKLLLLAISINVVDVVGNMLGFWQNVSISRTILGAFIGIMAVLMLSDNFLGSKDEQERDAYGLNKSI